MVGEEGIGASPEPGSGFPAFIALDLGVRQPAVVIDSVMDDVTGLAGEDRAVERR